MNKLKQYAVILFASLAFVLSTTHIQVSAGILDTVKDVVQGHVDDIKSRFGDAETLNVDKVIKRGQIDEDAPGQDFIHNSSGSVGIVTSNGKNYLLLSGNFKSSLGPDYHVYISYEDKIIDEAGFNEKTQIELGKLKRGSGESFYLLPDNIDVNKIKSFLLWCKRFGAYIGSADLT